MAAVIFSSSLAGAIAINAPLWTSTITLVFGPLSGSAVNVPIDTSPASDAILSLDGDLRSVVVLRDIEGLGYDEIAKVLCLPQGTVKSRLHRGRLILRDKLFDLVRAEGKK